ncbi:MAG: hypothetical protein HY709_01980 [Candidatus Latescibacteria bacterium]|nr:hypothetical protein [Candidatus Latescibacterota bacterium]
MRRVTRTPHPLIEPMRSVGLEQPQTASFLNNHYFEFERRFPYPGSRNPDDWKRWRRRLRRALRKTLRLDQLGPIPIPQPVVLETVEGEGYERQKIAYETFPGNWVSAYLLIPRGGGRRSAVICPHGHVKGGKEGVVTPQNAIGVAYGHEFARRGLIVLAPDNAGMGERDINPDQALHGSGGCMLAWVRLNHVGLDLTGLRVFDLIAGVSLLMTRPDVAPWRIGCAGLSGGCWLSQVLAALDRRIKAVILSGFFTTFVQTVWHGHCICHHPFGIGRLCDLPDLSALIAPRPQFVESGKQDTAYPLEPAFTMVRRAYDLLGVADRLGLDSYEGGHMFRGGMSIPWMVEQLRGGQW